MKLLTAFVLAFSLFFAHAQVDAQEAEKQKNEKDGKEIRDPLLDSPNKAEALDRQDSSILKRHHPFYFIYNHRLSKVQASFKTQMIYKFPVYFGYTQVMFWDIEEKSKPFRDLSFSPELFYRFDFKEQGMLRFLDVGVFGHTSNGKRDEDSRSLDRQYLRAGFEYEYRRWILRTQAQLSYLHGFDPTNKDIQRFMGPLMINITFIQLFDSWVDKSEIGFQAQPGGKFADRINRGGYQLSWSFRLGKLDLVPNFYVQYYHGYAETLLNYNQPVTELRGGVVF